MAAPWRIDRDDHASDAELVQLLDGAAAPAERARVQTHADACAACAGRLERQRRRSARLTLVLAEGDHVAALDRRAATLAASFDASAWRPASHRPFVPGYLRAAAVLVGLLALGWAVRPVRAWIAARWQALTAADVAVHPAQTPPVRGAAVDAAGAATSVAFVPGAADFVVAFESRPTGGHLSVRPTLSDRVTLTATGRAGVLVLPGELRVQNATSPASDYRVEVPAGVARLRVRVAGRTVLDVRPVSSPRPAGWTIDLGRITGGGAPAR